MRERGEGAGLGGLSATAPFQHRLSNRLEKGNNQRFFFFYFEKLNNEIE